MCGGSKSTSAPAPSQPTTFGYGAADNSNVAKANATGVGSTNALGTSTSGKLGSTALTGGTPSNDGKDMGV